MGKDLCASHEVKAMPIGLQLYTAAHRRSLPDMAEALACGADVNWAHPDDNKATPLIQAVLGVGAVSNVVSTEGLVHRVGISADQSVHVLEMSVITGQQVWPPLSSCLSFSCLLKQFTYKCLLQ